MKTLHSEKDFNDARHISYTKLHKVVENFLWGETELSAEFKKAFYRHIHRQFVTIGCCIIWSRDTVLEDLLKAHSLPSIGSREIIINKHREPVRITYVNEKGKIVSYTENISTFSVRATEHYMNSLFRKILSNDSYWAS